MPRQKQDEKDEIVKEFFLYAGDVRIEFRPDRPRKRYTIFDKGEKVKAPSVTTITNLQDKSGALMHWAVDNAVTVCEQKIQADQIHGPQYLADVWKEAREKYKDVKKKAADVGTLAHD